MTEARSLRDLKDELWIVQHVALWVVGVTTREAGPFQQAIVLYAWDDTTTTLNAA